VVEVDVLEKNWEKRMCVVYFMCEVDCVDEAFASGEILFT
jgi:hypothetical protein